MTATTYLRKKIVDLITGNASYVPPTIYLSLHTADPGVAGSHANEVSGGGYVRKSLASLMGPADSDGFSTNTAVITFPTATSDWGTIIFLAIEDAVSGGNMLAPGMPTLPRTITTGQPFQIPPGGLKLRQS
jgi:hypothetical protein